ncbi:uncharacterized protein EDB91DRAFT_1242855 [Suillus paluster]|uniref:uncharacterized protein n=1 Tax=Suillus paluster TaxID=48578 RepID=UPI001B867048|nr:uncharacterized protein EDB91DRAFT_1242855 [Suillus paluster]KAG1753891.1 hypothetical protein EDB91DRAFT_1242855 [Suillus paluster]
MDALSGLDADFVRRQGLDGLDLLDGSSGTQTAATPSVSNPLGGIFSAFTSLVNGVTSTSQSLTSSSFSSTGSTIKSASTTSTTSSSTPSTSSTSAPTPNSIPTPTPTPTSTPTPTPTPSTSQIVYTSTDGTSIVYVTSIATSSTSATAAPAESFLQNKPLEGGVFALVGIVVMVIIFVVVTYTIRRRRHNRLEGVIADAITFDPMVSEHYVDEESRMNTSDKYRLSGSSSGHGHGLGYAPNLAYAPPVPPKYPYYGQGYEQQAAAYQAPSTQGPVYNNDNAVNTSSANLTRKYSNRKPVPPLLPNPVYDPSRSPVLPSHYYMQGQEPPVSPIPRSTSPSAPAGDAPTPALPDNSEEDPYTGMLQACLLLAQPS